MAYAVKNELESTGDGYAKSMEIMEKALEVIFILNSRFSPIAPSHSSTWPQPATRCRTSPKQSNTILN